MTDSTPAVSDTPERLHIEWQVLDLRDGYAVSVFQDRVMALLRQQESALADARRDAERYRFLRESGNTGKNGDTLQRGITIANKFGAILHFVYWTDKNGFDATIDAAMSGGTGE